MKPVILLCALIFLYSCNSNNPAIKEIVKVDNHWIDSVKKASDTFWVKKYRNQDFVTAEYYVTKNDSIVTQLMKDSSGNVRQIIASKYDQTRLFFAEYYSNGQMKARLPLDSFGKYHGFSKYYYENGMIKSTGNYEHGFYKGPWKNYDEHGKYKNTDVYDSNGQLVK